MGSSSMCSAGNELGGCLRQPGQRRSLRPLRNRDCAFWKWTQVDSQDDLVRNVQAGKVLSYGKSQSRMARVAPIALAPPAALSLHALATLGPGRAA